MEWLKEFLKTYGLAGALALSLLLLASAAAQFGPIFRRIVGSSSGSERLDPTVAAQVAHHIEQSAEQTRALQAIQEQLRANHVAQSSQVLASRLICIRLSKTDSQRDECAKIP